MFDADGHAVLPSLKVFLSLFDERLSLCMEAAVKRFADSGDNMAAMIADIYSKEILPINSNPAAEDSDGDGLNDGKRQFYNGTVLLPKDYRPLEYDGPKGIWAAQRKTAESGMVQTAYDDDYEMPNLYMYQLSLHSYFIVDEILLNKYIANEYLIKAVKKLLKGAAEGEIQTSIGAQFLDFVLDDKYMAYHSKPETWQKAFGYNDIYDKIFDYGTEMERNKLSFIHDGKEHIIWSWKGDYWNLQSGAETGMYVYNRTVNGEKHYNVVNYNLPMTLSLYNSYDDHVQNIFCWAPDEPQWWITGFNPYYTEPDPDKMTMVCSINFSRRTDVYDSLKKMRRQEQDAELLFDDEYHTVWIVF